MNRRLEILSKQAIFCSQNKFDKKATRKVTNRVDILDNNFLQLDKNILLVASTATNESLDSFF